MYTYKFKSKYTNIIYTKNIQIQIYTKKTLHTPMIVTQRSHHTSIHHTGSYKVS